MAFSAYLPKLFISSMVFKTNPSGTSRLKTSSSFLILPLNSKATIFMSILPYLAVISRGKPGIFSFRYSPSLCAGAISSVYQTVDSFPSAPMMMAFLHVYPITSLVSPSINSTSCFSSAIRRSSSISSSVTFIAIFPIIPSSNTNAVSCSFTEIVLVLLPEKKISKRLFSIWSTYAETLGSSDETKTSYITFPLVACEKASIENITNVPVKNALILILCKLKKRMITHSFWIYIIDLTFLEFLQRIFQYTLLEFPNQTFLLFLLLSL